MANNEQYTDEDMANVGRSLMEAISVYFPDGYAYNDSPSEIVGDLCTEIEELKAEPFRLMELIRQMRADLSAYQGIAVELAQRRADYFEVLEALDALSFDSYSVFHHDPRFISIYNRTYDVLKKHIKAVEAEIAKQE